MGKTQIDAVVIPLETRMYSFTLHENHDKGVLYIYIFVCLCVCVCVYLRTRKEIEGNAMPIFLLYNGNTHV